MKFYTMSIFDGCPEWESHATREEAEDFAREVAEEGHDCQVLQVISTQQGKESSGSMEDILGLKAGVDFPATLNPGRS